MTKGSRPSKVGTCGKGRRRRGARGLPGRPPSCRRLAHRPRPQQVCPSAEARRPAPGPRAQRGQETDPRPGRLQSPPTRILAVPFQIAASLCPRLLLRLQILRPFSFKNEVSLQFEILSDRLQTELLRKHGVALSKVPPGRASRAVDWKGRWERVRQLSSFIGKNGSNPLGRTFSRVAVSKRGWLRDRNLKIGAKAHTWRPKGDAQIGLGARRTREVWQPHATGPAGRLAVRGRGGRLRKTPGRRRFPTEPAPAGSPGWQRSSGLAPQNRERKEGLGKGSRGGTAAK